MFGGCWQHFRHAVEGRYFILFTDHKPLTYALYTESGRYCPREIRHLVHISHFTTDFRHIKVESNCVADALSRQQLNAIKRPILDLLATVVHQADNKSCGEAANSSPLQCRQVPLATNAGTILRDIFAGSTRLIVPSTYRRLVLNKSYGLLHPGIAASLRLVVARNVYSP